ncbi:(d)CMP kinase [Thalassobacillus sp. CUG 92003]|uniref:(d)CMP kinase n=1 Tax=Thalassobacillus sp. CUG 92003 TaxID=2736641 RepID=UPI0015E66A65|nr:(d)CMP kinase [Thalassobacillus sp. CUG 92003]
MASEAIAVAIDGPAAAGKSTVARQVAYKLSYIYIDTGAMYRALTWKALQHSLKLDQESAMSSLLAKTSIKLEQQTDGQHVFVDGQDVTSDIRTQRVTQNVSVVAQHASVREAMVKTQQGLASKRGVVMDGRDIGTHVIPDAEVKIFLIASVEERAERRHKENVEKGFPSDLNALKEEIRARDTFDSSREVAPLVKAADAVEIDTTSLSIDQVVNRIIEIIQENKP